MTNPTDLTTRLAALCDLAGEIALAESLPETVANLDDAAVVELVKVATQLGKLAENIRLVAAGTIGARSKYTAGHSGLAQSLGFRSAVAFVQHVTGDTRTEAARQLRVGESLFEGGVGGGSAQAPNPSTSDTPDLLSPSAAPPVLWHAPLRSALMQGELSSAQHDAIRRGLGEPPTRVGALSAATVSADGTSAFNPETANAAAIEAWSVAAERLVEEAKFITVEDLAKQARAIRDLLDPEGAEVRFLARYEARSFRMWTDADGLTHGSFVFDDESAAWLRGVIDTALRPRRGGPRFVDPAAKAAAAELVKDPRTNDQLTHDLLLDVLRAGTLADATSVLGAKQAGVRLVQVVDRAEYLAEQEAVRLAGIQSRTGSSAGQIVPRAAEVTRLEDDSATLPAALAERQKCNTGLVPVIADRDGNALNIGREQRLYTAKQRIALAIRDGGCRWTGCDRPASYCEAHHIDEWVADGGRTDIDRGVLLCRFHHMQLHHGGWRITRDGLSEFLLHPPVHASVQQPVQPSGRASELHEKTPEIRHKGIAPPEIGGLGTAPPLNPSTSRNTKSNSNEITGISLDSPANPKPIELRPPLSLSYGWRQTPPPKRFRLAS